MPDELGRQGDAWMAQAMETLLFRQQPLYPNYKLRTVAFLGKDERRLEPPAEDAYVVSAEEREAIIAAFRETFEGRKAVLTAEDDGYYLSGRATIEASGATKAWNYAAGALFQRLQRGGGVRDAKEALKALDFLFVEIVEEGVDDLVAWVFSDKGLEDV